MNKKRTKKENQTGNEVKKTSIEKKRGLGL